ncbi:MAG TPA: TIGR01777 family oxidoreductase [Blastocatellia bacterium]|nr:TIGR01777 family oxidoreductase [Blastocatellia bacterium]
MMKILITGATGLIGRQLCQSLLREGHTVIGLSRRPEKARDVQVTEMHRWDAMSGPPDARSLGGADAVIHLAGEPIAARRWSDAQKKRVRDSRVVSTRHLVDGLLTMTPPPAAFISSSAVGFYGDRGDELLDEQSPAGRGFMPEVCKAWEDEAERAATSGIRVVRVRTGVVLSREGGALEKLRGPFSLGLGGKLGSGRQWFPWIHMADMIDIYRMALMSESLSGPVNATAPEPVTNAELTRRLAAALHRPAFVPVPELGLRAVLGEMADVLLSSQRVLPQVLMAAGYGFRFASLKDALADLLG